MSTKILFTFEAEDLGVAKKQDEISDRLKQIRKDIQAAKQAGSPYTEFIKESQSLKREQDELRKRQRELNREFAATKVPKDSLAGLRLEYSKLVDQINKLSAAQRNSDFGKNLISQAASAKNQINALEAEVGRFTGNVGNYKQAITSTILTIGTALGGINLAGNIIATTRETEKLFAVLKNAVGNDLAAASIFKDLQDFAANTPFALNEVVGAFTKLEQRNFDPTIEQLKTIGDIASASGKSIDQFVEAILDAQTGEFERLKEFGVVAKKEGDNVRVTFRGQAETFKNTAENLNEYLLGLGKLPGISGATAAVSQTLDGALSNLGDNVSRLFSAFGSGGGIIQGVVDEFNRLLGFINDIIDVPLSETIRDQQTEFNALVGILQDVNTSESTRKSAIEQLQLQYPDYIGNINLESASQSELNGLLDSGNQLFERRLFLQQNEEKLNEFAKQRLQTQKLLFEAEKDLQKLQQSGQAGQGTVRFGTGGGDGVRQTETRGESATGRVEALRQQLEKLNEAQRQFVEGQEQFATSLFGSADAAKEAAKEIKKTDSASGGTLPTGDKESAKKAAQGSVQFFRDEVKRLQDELEKTPVKSPLVDGLIKKLKDAETQLRVVEQQLKDLRNPPGAPVSEFDQANAGLAELGVSIDPNGEADAAAQLKSLADNLAASVGVTIPVELSLDEQEGQRTLNKLNQLEAENQKKQQSEAEAAAEKKRQQEEQESEALKSAAIDSAQAVSDAVFQIKQNELEKEQSAALEKLNAEEQAALDAAQGNAAKEKLIREDFEKRRAALEKEGARKRKELAKKEALINTALAVTKALTGAPPPFSFVLAGVAAIAGAAQLAVIESQEFWQGGKVKRLGSGKVRERQNAPRTAHGDTVLAYLAPGEMVLNEQQQSRIQGIAGRNVFARAGVPGYANATPMPHFASGGVVGDIVPQTTAYSYAGASGAQVQASFTNDQVLIIARTIAGEVSTQVGSEVRTGIGVGLNDANRRLEREEALQTNRQG